MAAHGIDATDDQLLETFARHEAAAEAGPYRRYREVLGVVLKAMVEERGGSASADEVEAFGGSVADWPAFPDSAAALARLHERFKLGVITNCDDDLFAASEAGLGLTFDWVVTAQQAKRYKPNPRGFELMFERVGLPPRGSCTWRRARSTTTRRRIGSGCRRVWSTGGATEPDPARPPRPWRPPDLRVPDMCDARAALAVPS